MDEAKNTPDTAGDKPFDFDAVLARQQEIDADLAKLRELREDMEPAQAAAERRWVELGRLLAELEELERLGGLEQRITDAKPEVAWWQEFRHWFKGGGGLEGERRLMETSELGLRRLQEWHFAQGHQEAGYLLWFLSSVLSDRLQGHGWPSLAENSSGQGVNLLRIIGMMNAWLYIEAARRGLTDEHDPDPIGTVCRVYAPEDEPPLALGTVYRWARGKHFDRKSISRLMDKGGTKGFPRNEVSLRRSADLYNKSPSDTFP